MDSYPEPPTGRIEGRRHLFPVRVYYEDTDLSGIVYHANYLKYCERARSDILRCLGIDQRAAVEAGLGAYAVADAQILWKRPARLDDCLVVETRASELKAASIRMVQHIVRPGEGTAQLLAEVSIRIGFISSAGRAKRQPEEWRQIFEHFIEKDPE